MIEKILLNDLLNLSDEEIQRTKIKFNILEKETNSHPMDIFLDNPEDINDGWLFWRNKYRNFEINQIAISFVQLKENSDSWLLTTIKTVSEELNIKKGINYKGTEIVNLKKYFGRVIFKYKKSKRVMVPFIKNIINEIEVEQVLPDIYNGKGFPGYDNVQLSYKELANIIKRNKIDWVNALINQKAIYLITDLRNGKQYVGSAYGDNGMLLQRWKNYVANGHGDNKLLEQIVLEHNFDYIKENFQYSILENFNSTTNKDFILSRESWWKNTLGSRAFGLNAN